MKFKRILNHKYLILIILTAIILRIIQLSRGYTLWWDSYVYIGMGKYFFTLGNAGLWEAFRPLGWPILLGFLWKIGLPIVASAKALDLIFSITTICLVYLISKEMFSKVVALLTTFIFATFPLFVMYTGLVLTEPLSLSLALLGIYMFVKTNTSRKIEISFKSKDFKSLVLIGALLSLSFLTKFPAGIFLVVIILSIISSKGYSSEKIKVKVRNCLIILISFFVITIPYFILNKILYGNFLEPITSGSWIVNTSLWQYNTSLTFYFTEFFLANKILILGLFFAALFLIKKDWLDKNKLMILLAVIFPLLYFIFMVQRKEIRYMTIILPFVAMMVAAPINFVYEHLKKLSKKVKAPIRPTSFMVLTIIMIILSQASVYGQIKFDTSNYGVEYTPQWEEIKDLIIEYSTPGKAIFSSNPNLIILIDNLIYPTGDLTLAQGNYEWKVGLFNLIYIDTCNYQCQSLDQECLGEKIRFLEFIDENHILLSELEYEVVNSFTDISEVCQIKLYRTLE